MEIINRDIVYVGLREADSLWHSRAELRVGYCLDSVLSGKLLQAKICPVRWWLSLEVNRAQG